MAEMINKKAEASFLTFVIENISEGLCACHNTNEFPYVKFTVWNKRMTELTGYTIDEINLSGWYQTVYPDPDIQEKAIKRMEEMRHGNDLRGEEWEITRSDGNKKWLSISTSIVKDENNTVNVMAVMIDITERKQAEKEKERLEAQLCQVHKMEAIGTMAGGIAHDFNNILSIIMSNADMALLDIPKDNPAMERIESILDSSYRAKDLVSQILSFTRQTNQKAKPINIIQATEESLKLLRSIIPTSVEIRKKFKLGEGVIVADPTQFNQLMINLCTNAVQAMHNNGVLEVSLTEVNFTDQDLRNQLGKKSGEYIRLTLTDTGEGIDPAIIDRIFDPFYTTREVGQGTGVGLSLVHGIVASYSGFIKVDSELGKGSAFHVFFPKAVEIPIDDEIEDSRTLPTGNERILFVDDEKLLAKMSGVMLERLGYIVTILTRSNEALKTFKSQPDGFDLIITDMAMPDLTGKDLATELLKIRPDIPIILCTGYSSMITKESAKEIGIREFCMKPIGWKQLATTVRKVLDENVS
jgi:PAS domain S-box-containing protein